MALASDYPELVSKIVIVDALLCLMALNNPNFTPNPDDCKVMVSTITNMENAYFKQMQRTNTATLTLDQTKFEKIVNWSLQSNRITFAKISLI